MKQTIIGILVSLLIFFVAGEVFVRLFEQAEVKVPPYDTAEKDDYLGWKPKGNYHYVGEMKDARNQSYPLEIRTAPNGFRTYGRLEPGNFKILFIGDSYTQAVEVSNDKTFYHHLKDSLGAEVFAHGMAGYGNAQQYLILKEHFDSIQPHLVVLQTCANDFIDNHHRLEMESIYQVGLRRPYIYEGEQIEYHLPKPGIGPQVQWSAFLTFIYEKLRHIKKAKTDPEQMAEGLIASQELEYEPFRLAVEATNHHIQLIRDLVGNKATLVAFSSDEFEPQVTYMEKACQQAGIPFFRSPYQAIQEARAQKQVVHSVDGYHWNEAGHRIIAEALLKKIPIPIAGTIEGDSLSVQ